MRRAGVAAALLGVAAAAPAPAPVAGRWLTAEGKALVAIAPCSGGGGSLCGRVVRVLKAPPGVARALDINNPDPSLRSRSIEGVAILSGFHAAGDRWAGRIYDPESGRTYRSELRRTGATLKVKGCWGPFCRTQAWTAAR